MSIKERRERQKEATKESILATALEIARKEGWEAVTVRHVAELIEYSPPIIYQYFVNKAALLEELQDRGFQMMGEALYYAAQAEATSQGKLLNIADAYVIFAYAQPELYQLMHGWSSAEVDLDRTLERATAASEIVLRCLESWADARNVVLNDPDSIMDTAWGLMHGLVSVEMMGRIAGGKERVRQLARQAFIDLLTAYAAR